MINALYIDILCTYIYNLYKLTAFCFPSSFKQNVHASRQLIASGSRDQLQSYFGQ